MPTNYERQLSPLPAIQRVLTGTRSDPRRQVFLRYAEQAAKNCPGVHGVRDPGLVDTYERTLVWALDVLTGSRIGMQKPPLPVTVFIFEIGEWRGEPYPVTFKHSTSLAMGLPCRFQSATPAQQRMSAGSAAVHEMCHVVCYSQPGMANGGIADPRWSFLGEGTAVWMEMLLATDRTSPCHSRQYLEFALDWCDRPDVPLDATLGEYQAFLFVHYLTRSFGGKAFIGKIWKSAKTGTDAWDVLRTLTKKVADEVFRDYAAEAYLLNEPSSRCYAPAIYKRFGPRALSGYIDLAKGQVAQIAGEVWGLASPYYRVAVPDGTDVEIDCPGPEWGRAMALAAGVATSTHTRVTPTVMPCFRTVR